MSCVFLCTLFVCKVYYFVSLLKPLLRAWFVSGLYGLLIMSSISCCVFMPVCFVVWYWNKVWYDMIWYDMIWSWIRISLKFSSWLLQLTSTKLCNFTSIPICNAFLSLTLASIVSLIISLVNYHLLSWLSLLFVFSLFFLCFFNKKVIFFFFFFFFMKQNARADLVYVMKLLVNVSAHRMWLAPHATAVHPIPMAIIL